MTDELWHALTAELRAEMAIGHRRYGPIVTPEDGLCRLLMEADELAEAIRVQSKSRAYGGADHTEQIRAEAVQVAALAMRLVAEVCVEKRHLPC